MSAANWREIDRRRKKGQSKVIHWKSGQFHNLYPWWKWVTFSTFEGLKVRIIIIKLLTTALIEARFRRGNWQMANDMCDWRGGERLNEETNPIITLVKVLPFEFLFSGIFHKFLFNHCIIWEHVQHINCSFLYQKIELHLNHKLLSS